MERELIERLKRPMTMSMYSTIGDLAADALAERRMAADLIESLRAQLDEARKRNFEEAAQMAEAFTFHSRVNGLLVRSIQDETQCPPCDLAAAIRQRGERG